mgnify:CR=1 FL=1
MAPDSLRRGCVIGLCLFALGGASAAAEDPGKAKAELTELRERMGALQDKLNSARSQESSLARDVREVEQRIGALNRTLRDTKIQLRTGEQRLNELQDEYARTSARLENERQLLGRQLRAAYLLGRQEQVKLLLNQEDPARFGRTLTYYRYLNQARLTRIEQVEGMLVELDALQQRIATQREAQAASQERQAAEMAELDQERERRSELLKRLQADIRSQGDELAQMQKNEKRLEQLLKDLQRALAEVAPAPPPADGGKRQPFAKLKRKLPWPVAGKLKAKFGDRREVGELRWRGAFIAAPASNEVRAVAHGRVAFADWLRGFGLLVIVDHGNDYMTLYGHNQSVFKEVGDTVLPGEVIASVGDTGGMAQTGVYFELRHKGEPLDPLAWCAGKPETTRAAR